MRAAILLPPSKGQHAGGTGTPWSELGAQVSPAQRTVAKALRSAMRTGNQTQLAKLLGATGDTLRDARAMNSTVLQSPTMPAIERYRGVLYEELAYATMLAAARRRADRSLLIFGALHGVALARAPLPAHRLAFTAAFPELGRLATWWRPRITEELGRMLQGAVVWDLSPRTIPRSMQSTHQRLRNSPQVR